MSETTAKGFSRLVRYEETEDGPVDLAGDAHGAELLAITERLAAGEVRRLAFTARAERQGGGLAVSGRVRCEIERQCVVTLDPFVQHLDEPFRAMFVTDPAPPEDETLGEGDLEEALVDGTADVGDIAVQFLALALDPHPRKPGAEIDVEKYAPEADQSADSANEGRPSPFAALAALKKPPSDSA